MDWTRVMTIAGGDMALFLWAIAQVQTESLNYQRLIEVMTLMYDRRKE